MDASHFRRMLILAAGFLIGSLLVVVMGPILDPRGVLRLPVSAWVLGSVVLAGGQIILIEEDVKRRGTAGPGSFLMCLLCLIPPLGAAVYLFASYRVRGVTFVSLYFGLIGLWGLAGWGLGVLLRAAP